MLFNSIEFLFFLPIVFCLYWFVFNKVVRIQNILILGVSYVFYGWWDYRFLSLILISSVVDYFLGIAIGKSDKKKGKWLLATSLIVNLSFLGFFKYYNFFAESFGDLLNNIGLQADIATLNIVLPVGISFYTFQTLSYSIDIYRRKLAPTTDLVGFMAYVSFFPQLVAGPIERASNLLPQFFKKRTFDAALATEGLRQMLWGFFKKVVIADNCATLVNDVFAAPGDQSASMLLVGAIFFAFQIYGDFSGYSDIAIGCAKLFGFNLKTNFALPYFSRDIAEFWRRWHISLSTWFRDYLYIPLGGSRGSKWFKVRNTMIIFLVSGFWHGANWTFMFWGLLHALFFLPLLLSNRNRNNVGTVAEGRLLPNFRELFAMGFNFMLVTLAWVYFRADSISVANTYLQGLADISLFNMPPVDGRAFITIGMIGVMLFFEWKERTCQFPLQHLADKPAFRRRVETLAVIGLIFFFGVFKANQFIYFQF